MLRLGVKLVLLLLAAVSAGVLWQQGQLSVLALTRVDPLPQTRELVAAGHYAEAADYLAFFMDYPYVQQDPAAQVLHEEIEQVRGSMGYQARKLQEGLVSGTSDEGIGQAAGVATDLFVIGDLRDLTRQAIRWKNGEDVDEVVTALAAIGVAASAIQLASSAATVASAGAAAPAAAAATGIKTGTSVLKAARKLGKLPPWLGKAVIGEAQALKRTRNLEPISGLFTDVATLASTRGGLQLLSHTTDASSLRRMARLSEVFGEHSATLYRLGGDLAVGLSQRAARLGPDTIRLAATFGRGGLRTLDRLGAVRFAKYSARAAKITYKGDAVRLLARALLRVPNWLLGLLVVIGVAAWLPWPAPRGQGDRARRRAALGPRF